MTTKIRAYRPAGKGFSRVLTIYRCKIIQSGFFHSLIPQTQIKKAALVKIVGCVSEHAEVFKRKKEARLVTLPLTWL